jgi:hypothetical protein
MDSPTSSTRLGNWLTRSKMDFFFGCFLFAQIALFVGLESTPGILDRQGRVRGRDFLQFYVAGRIAGQGEARRLYDQGYFLELQRSLVAFDEKRPPYLSIYPPQVALLFSPLGRLSYDRAIQVWWLVQAACFLIAGCLLHRILGPAPGWRHTAWLGLFAFYPVINTFWNGQLAALLLPILILGLGLYGHGHSVLAGAVLAMLAMKPQLAAGIALWLVLRGNLRAAAGFCVGVVLQTCVVAALLSPSVIADFARTVPLYSQHYRLQQFTPDHQHAVTGIIVALLGATYSRWAVLIQLLLVIYAGSLVLRIPRREWGIGVAQEVGTAVLFGLLMTPHLLTYDLTYLLIPITYLVSGTHVSGDPPLSWPAVLLYLGATLSPLYGFLGFSMMPILMIWALHFMVHQYSAKGGPRQTITRSPGRIGAVDDASGRRDVSVIDPGDPAEVQCRNVNILHI